MNQNRGPLPARAQRGPLVQALTRANPWWTQPQWQDADPQLLAARRAPFDWTPPAAAPGIPRVRALRRLHSPGAAEPELSRLAQAALAATIFRAVDGLLLSRCLGVMSGTRRTSQGVFRRYALLRVAMAGWEMSVDHRPFHHISIRVRQDLRHR
jgi:hypothetical protein